MLEIFEVDHPATQTMKTHRISECGVSLLRSVHFIAADLAKEDLVALHSETTRQHSSPGSG
ncbi:hypothetical protein BF49_4723 [Bradyrhizobium sp.]|nr:hypothetical protein BF49_4723 [Bradyrhizobium sp.]